MIKFADYTKIFRRIGNSDDHSVLQDYLGKLAMWSHERLMLFNAQQQCKVIHIGKLNKNKQNNYCVNGQDKFPRPTLKGMWEFSYQKTKRCSARVLMLIVRQELIKKIIKRKSKDVLRLYKSLVRPHVE